MNRVSRLEYYFLSRFLTLYNRLRTRKLDKRKLIQLVESAKEKLKDRSNRRDYLRSVGFFGENEFTDSQGYLEFKKDIEAKAEYFNDKWFQCGALDDEIDLIIDLAGQIGATRILEIGVANGYSSAMLYKYAELARTDVTITSIDLPRFEPNDDEVTGLYKVIKKVSSYSPIETTGTVLDIKPGGIVPRDKWCGWLVPPLLRARVPNNLFIGDVFSVIDELGDASFDLIVIDAMKDYESRFKLLDRCLSRLIDGGIVVLDGAWINPAFDDFCEDNNLESRSIGRISWAHKRRS
jgi:predicted O-methyltransferase YrrM